MCVRVAEGGLRKESGKVRGARARLSQEGGEGERRESGEGRGEEGREGAAWKGLESDYFRSDVILLSDKCANA